MSAARGLARLGGAARAVLRVAGVLPAATTVLWLSASPSGAAPTTGWGARVSLDGGYTDGVFHDETLSSPDRFAVLAAGLSRRFDPPGRVRLEALGGVTVERYQTWTASDAETWEGELRARLGGFRARVRGRYAPHLLLYPDALGGALYRSSQQLGGLEWRSAGGLIAGMDVRHEHQVFDVDHLGRTQSRLRWGTLAGWEPRPGSSIAARFDNQHAVATDPNYDFWENQLTLTGNLALPGILSARVEVAQGIRNYFTSSIFSSNWRRHDRTGEYRVEVRRLLGPVEVGLRDEYLVRGSSRIDHNYHVNALGLVLGWSLGR